MDYPKKVLHWIDDRETEPQRGKFFDKYDPATGEKLTEVAGGTAEDAEKAIGGVHRGYERWRKIPVLDRAKILRQAALLIQERKEELAEVIAQECGKSKKDARSEIEAAVECGFFFAGEGQRYNGVVLPSGADRRTISLIRQSMGVGALITPFNNPAAGIAWKLFPALLCGNAVVIKAHEYTPYTPVLYAKIFREAGVPADVISVVQGSGSGVGAPLIADRNVKFVSFTGSVETARFILKETANRLAKVLIEAGGKNPFVVCDDADLNRAVEWAVKSAFVDAGQRCAAASRIIVMNTIYDDFLRLFLEKVKQLRAGTNDTDDFGAIISEPRLNAILKAVNSAVSRGAELLSGGNRVDRPGYFMEPTVISSVSPDDDISQSELFGPVVCIYRAKYFSEAVMLAKSSPFRLTAAIHTKNMDRAQEFINEFQGGVVRVNGPTHGSEPHVPFGGLGISGNGWREPGFAALDFYSEWKQVSIDYHSTREF
ncbi:MAG: aldehyde dehydrogenase [Candidatus Sungiibacteriota bacterium]|uniref:Aldehyde dehydrogenase n=1 Tax=Candidatus Sungiibacteriota bacterium TaxID=2750080 RepID=A0A7T5RJS2_9BACT|nr:MAG: aldehyde dehydrogenase [Candidatus Sungbacteria bacterium]